MGRFAVHALQRLACVVPLMFVALCADPAPAQAGDKPKGQAMILVSAEGASPFVLEGTAPHFGRFACYGEIEFQRGSIDGSLDGVGVAALEAADGDVIVGVVSCHIDADGAAQIHFSWRDSVEFSDGTIATNTGRFERRRPPGVVIAIIAILIG